MCVCVCVIERERERERERGVCLCVYIIMNVSRKEGGRGLASLENSIECIELED